MRFVASHPFHTEREKDGARKFCGRRSKANSAEAELAYLATAGCAPYSSRISTAAAIVVVHSPRLSPIADCVTLLVRTILLEMR